MKDEQWLAALLEVLKAHEEDIRKLKILIVALSGALKELAPGSEMTV